MKKLLLPSLLVLTLILTSTTTVFAQKNLEKSREELKQQIEEKHAEIREKLASKSALRKERLEATKQRVCEQRKNGIVRRSTRLAERAERQLANFSSKVERLADFYNNKMVPDGKTVGNYDELVADIEGKKLAVQEAIDSAKTTATNFDCAGDDPKGQLGNYRTDMQNAITALKEYRTSIKNLIVAVRTAFNNNTASSSANN